MAGTLHSTDRTTAATGWFSFSLATYHTNNDSRYHDNQNNTDDDCRHIFNKPCKHLIPPVITIFPGLLPWSFLIYYSDKNFCTISLLTAMWEYFTFTITYPNGTDYRDYPSHTKTEILQMCPDFLFPLFFLIMFSSPAYANVSDTMYSFIPKRFMLRGAN